MCSVHASNFLRADREDGPDFIHQTHDEWECHILNLSKAETVQQMTVCTTRVCTCTGASVREGQAYAVQLSCDHFVPKNVLGLYNPQHSVI